MNVRRLSRLLLLTLVTAGTSAVGPALAQAPDPNVAVRDRPRPDFDPLGIRAGGFLIFPTVTVDGAYDDNIFATKNDTEDDFIFSFRPAIRVQSNFPRHSLNFGVTTDIGRYVDHTDENYFDYGFATDGRFDITRNNRVTGAASFGRGHEGRGDPEDQGGKKPTEFFNYVGSLGFEQDFNRLNFRVLGDFDRRNFRNNGGLDNADRDRNIYGGTLRTGYFVSPRINAFVQGSYAAERRDRNRDSTGVKRNNDRVDVAAGTEVDITGIMFGEVFGGWGWIDFDDSSFDSQNSFIYGAALTWNVTRLTSLRLDGSGNFAPTDVTFEGETASSNLRSAVGLRADHELLRNVLIGGGAGYVRNDFQGTGRTDNTYSFGADITYLINRYFSVGAGYNFETRDSDDKTAEFDRNLFTLRVNARL